MAELKQSMLKLRLSTLLLLLAIAALITNSIRIRMAYESEILRIKQVISAEIIQLEEEYDSSAQRLGPGHRDTKTISKRIERLQEAQQ